MIEFDEGVGADLVPVSRDGVNIGRIISVWSMAKRTGFAFVPKGSAVHQEITREGGAIVFPTYTECKDQVIATEELRQLLADESRREPTTLLGYPTYEDAKDTRLWRASGLTSDDRPKTVYVRAPDMDGAHAAARVDIDDVTSVVLIDPSNPDYAGVKGDA